VTGGPSSLTTRGRGLLIGSLLLIFAGFLVGIPELYALGVAGLILVAAARIYVSARRVELVVRRAAQPGRVPAGTDARVEITVTNSSIRSSPPVLAADPFDGGRRWARFVVAPIPPSAARAASYKLPTHQRGVFRLGPLEIAATDPFGLAKTTRRGGEDATLTVHPRFEMLSMRMPPSPSELDSSTPVHVAGRGGNEFFTLRAYEPGDDLRRVHWPSSARVDDLVVRQPENRRQTKLTIAADLRAGAHDAASLESALSACASVALSGLAEGVLVRLITSGGVDTGFTAGPGEGGIILDALSAATAHPGTQFPPEWKLASERDPVVLITTDSAHDGDLSAVLGRGGSRPVRVLVLERAGRPSPPRGSPGGTVWGGSYPAQGRPGGTFPTIRVPVGTSLWLPWEQASW
jgi:uncharacterized protein (DUF58 family)